MLSEGQVVALTLTLDGVLNEWVGNEISNLGTEPAPEGGSYTLLAAWNGTNLYLGVDRETSGRYLGDIPRDNDSFFIAVDTDGIPNSGAYSDGYGIMNFNGPLLPDVVFYYAGSGGWYERTVWDGFGWLWAGWTSANQYYGWQPANPNDELIPDLLAMAPTLSGAHELSVWAWMTRENNNWVEASWPRGYTGNYPVMNAPVKIRDLDTRLFMPHDPDPVLYEEDVLVSGLILSWGIAQDSLGNIDPSLYAYKLYIGSSSNPTLTYQGTISTWDVGTRRASYAFTTASKDETYFWRVDTVLNTSQEIEGDVWTFYTELTTPQITKDPDYQVVEAGTTAVFSIIVNSPSTPIYQWYKYVDGISDIMLSDGSGISGAKADTLYIANVNLMHEGGYYCIVNNDSGIPDTSAKALLGIKRKIAYWTFEGNNADSIIAGSPVSFLYGDPTFAPGKVGDGMAFDNDTGAEDLLYTNPDQSSYFNICSYTMTAACWIKSSFAATWGPMVARNGEDNQGWQLRHNGLTLDRICFTTRGTGNDDGTASNRTVYDGNWHYVAATYDGTVKKIYIDGVLSRIYNKDNGSIEKEYDQASGLINPSESPVSLAGRVKGGPGTLVFEAFTPCTLDEVEIYNYALDAATIAQIYANITGVAFCPVPQAYDLDGNCVIDFVDLARLASVWLEDSRVKPIP